jgi:hypothetical protein
MTWFEGDMWSSIIHSVYDGNKCDLSYRRNNKNEEHTLPQKQLHVVAEEYGTRTGTWSHVLKTEFCISNLPFVENVTLALGAEPVLVGCTQLCSPVPGGLFPCQLAGLLCNQQSGDTSLLIHLFPFKHISVYTIRLTNIKWNMNPRCS